MPAQNDAAGRDRYSHLPSLPLAQDFFQAFFLCGVSVVQFLFCLAGPRVRRLLFAPASLPAALPSSGPFVWPPLFLLPVRKALSHQLSLFPSPPCRSRRCA